MGTIEKLSEISSTVGRGDVGDLAQHPAAVGCNPACEAD
jgi:hypothetical protein